MGVSTICCIVVSANFWLGDLVWFWNLLSYLPTGTVRLLKCFDLLLSNQEKFVMRAASF